MAESEGEIRIEALARRHRVCLDDFDNQHPVLVEYLRRFALPHMERDRITRTRVALVTVQGQDRIAGYYSLAAASVEREALTGVGSLSKLPGFPVPAILLARLAVHRSIQGQGLGAHLFVDALRQVEQVAALVGTRLFVTDAKDDAAVEFYRRRNMFALTEGFPRRMALDLRLIPASQR
jgi:GNAT superfamily N-acetyltransferase